MIRPFPLLLAVALLGAAWGPVLDTRLEPFTAHMTRHILLVALAAPALVLAFPRISQAIAPPVLVGAAFEAVVVWGWHAPHLHAMSQNAVLPFVLEQALFLFAGLAVWSGALRARVPLAGAGSLLFTSMHMTLLGALLVLAPRDLYADISGRASDLTGQQLGGILMLAIGTPAYLVGGLILSASSLREQRS